MKVMILCGGQGTRIRDADWDLPKALIPVQGRPILWHIMNHYTRYGLTEFILCVGYKADRIQEYFSQNPHPVFKIHYSNAGEAAMTGTRIKAAESLIESDENFCLTYGDGLSDIHLNNLIQFHQNTKKILTMTAVNPPARFGELSLDVAGNVLGFSEKPKSTDRKISGGFFVCRPEIFHYLSAQNNEPFETGAIPKLVQDQQVSAYIHEGFWAPMDTYRDFLELNSPGLLPKFFLETQPMPEYFAD